jgi:hypothetical protein
MKGAAPFVDVATVGRGVQHRDRRTRVAKCLRCKLERRAVGAVEHDRELCEAASAQRGK